MHKCAMYLCRAPGLRPALAHLTMNADEYFESTIDESTSNKFFRAIESMERKDERFRAAVPPHLRPEAVAHWDGAALY